MKQLVCESLQEFFKIDENVETAKQLFAQKDISSNAALYKEFFELLSEVPEKDIDKYAEWVVNAGIDPDYIKTELDKLETNKLTLDKEVNAFGSFRDFRSYIKEKINQKDQEKVPEKPEEDKNVRQEIIKQPEKLVKTELTQSKEDENQINDKKTLRQLQREERKQKRISDEFGKALLRGEDPGMFGYTLFVYAVYVAWKGVPYVKFGETYQNNKDDAKQYAMRHTVGKISGLLTEEDIIFCEDVSDIAIKMNPKYVFQKHQQFDDVIRKYFPGKSGSIKNPFGIRSDELHEHTPNESFESIKTQWINALEKLRNKDFNIKPTRIYEARPFHKEMSKKISQNLSDPEYDKFLLAAATGAGKEVTTLEQLIHIHDNLQKRINPKTGKPVINENTIHVSCATIPETELELIEELSKVVGMQMTNSKMTPFARIKGYCLEKFKSGYYGKLTDNAKLWFDHNIESVSSVSQIPKNKNFPQVVPVLFGSFPDLGLKQSGGDPHGVYLSLRKRIGILAIGEAHKFLSKISNKMFPAVKKKLNYKFLLLITGTPYDYIFNETGDLYFPPEQRALFTRSDLYEEKRRYLETGEGDPAFAAYPDIYYYKLNIADVIQQMKNDKNEPWQGDEHSFTYQKLFEYDKKLKKFKYEDAIIFFFRRLLGFNKQGSADELSISNAKDLCDYAKRHIIIALPVGSGGTGVHTYIPELEKLLVNNGALGKYESYVSYQDDLSDVKSIINEDKSPTAIFTCNKLLTGTNIPAWGSIIFLRSIGNSVKFFEQAVGRVGRAFNKKDEKTGKTIKEKNNVGVFLGDINNVMNIHVSVDEKLSIERGENKDYSTIVSKTYNNYFFFDNRNGKWEKFTMPEVQEALREVSGEIDYRFNLCLNNPKPPKDFNLEFLWSESKASTKVDVTDPQGPKGKNKEIIERVKQLQLDFDKAKDKERWYRNMIKTHISKILIICLLKGFKTIQEFSTFIKKAIKDEDLYTLELVGLGAELIPKYIDDDKQIDRKYLNRWLNRIKEESSEENTIEGMKERHHDINEEMDLSKLSASIIFDPLLLTEEMCSKIKETIKTAKRILILEKNGSFIYSILKRIGLKNVEKITLVIFDRISSEIVNYIVGPNAKLIDIKYIKDINELNTMGKFDVVIGNPPYQEPSKTREGKSSLSANKLWMKFITISVDKLVKPDGYLYYIVPSNWIGPANFIRNKINSLNLIEGNLSRKIINYFEGIGGSMNFSTILLQNSPKKDIPTFTFDNGSKKIDILNMPIVPVKSSNYIDFTALNRMLLNKTASKLEWKREDDAEHHKSKIKKVYVPMARGTAVDVKYSNINDINSCYTYIPKNDIEGEIIAHNLNLKLYKRLRWVIRSGMAITSDIRNLPIPTDKKYTDAELYKYFDLETEEIDFIDSQNH
jgi:hypothetical protein